MHAHGKKAKQLFEQAEINYRLGRFKDALKGYTAAYEKEHRPEFIFNAGQCSLALKRYERAIFFFQMFLADATESAPRKLAQRRIAEARAALAAQASTESGSAEMPEMATAASPPTAAAVSALDPKQGDPAAPPAFARPPRFYERWWFWGIVTGVAIAATGTAYYYVITAEPKRVLPRAELETIDIRPSQ